LLNAHVTECGVNKPLVITFPSPYVKVKKTKNKKEKNGVGGEEVPIESLEDLIGITEADAQDEEVRAYAEERAEKNGIDPPNILKFTNIIRQFPQTFVIYCDFESFISPDGDRDKHVPSGFCCQTVSIFPQYNNCQPFVYSGVDVMQNFFDHLRREQLRIESILCQNVPMKPLKEADRIRSENVKNCECCGNFFSQTRKKSASSPARDRRISSICLLCL